MKFYKNYKTNLKDTNDQLDIELNRLKQIIDNRPKICLKQLLNDFCKLTHIFNLDNEKYT